MLFRKLLKLQINKLIGISSSYDKSIKGPQLQEKDLVLVKIVAHKGRHKLQDKWEPEEICSGRTAYSWYSQSIEFNL